MILDQDYRVIEGGGVGLEGWLRVKDRQVLLVHHGEF